MLSENSQAIRSATTSANKQQDEFDAFSIIVARKLRNMTTDKSDECMAEILSLLTAKI